MRKPITALQYMEYNDFECESEAEKRAFVALVDEFADFMTFVFNEKVNEGKMGWDNPKIVQHLKEKIVAKTKKICTSGLGYTPEDLIDLANLTAMLYNLTTVDTT